MTGTRTGYDRFFPDDRSALSGHPGGSGSPKLWDVTTGNEIRSLPDTHETSVAFSPEGRIALSSGFGKTVALWDIAAGNKIPTFTGHAEYIPSVAFSPDGRAALSGSKDKTLKLWDIATGYNIRAPLPGIAIWSLRSLLARHAAGVQSVAFSADGRTALSGSDDETLKLWDLTTDC